MKPVVVALAIVWPKMRAFFNQGNATTLSQLQRHFARRP